MQDVMGGKTGLFGQAQRLELRTVEDRIAARPRAARIIAMPAPQRERGDGRIDFGHAGQCRRRAAGMRPGRHSAPVSFRAAA